MGRVYGGCWGFCVNGCVILVGEAEADLSKALEQTGRAASLCVSALSGLASLKRYAPTAIGVGESIVDGQCRAAREQAVSTQSQALRQQC